MSCQQGVIGHGCRRSTWRETDNCMISLGSKLCLSLGGNKCRVIYSVEYRDSQRVIRRMSLKQYHKDNEF